MEDLLMVEEVAGRLKLHVGTVRRMLRDGTLPGVKMGPRQWRVPAAALADYVNQQLGYYKAYVEVETDEEHITVQGGGRSRDEAIEWCKQQMSERKGTRARVEQYRPEPEPGKKIVWEFNKAT
jgi:excisionase family DNA binding protein